METWKNMLNLKSCFQVSNDILLEYQAVSYVAVPFSGSV